MRTGNGGGSLLHRFHSATVRRRRAKPAPLAGSAVASPEAMRIDTRLDLDFRARAVLGDWAFPKLARENPPAIVVAEDDPASRSLTCYVLESAGYRVLPAADGDRALSLAGNADLLLLDIRMPGIQGVELCRIVKGMERTRFVPVVMLTALGSAADKMTAIEAGADDYLVKPIDVLELVIRVRCLLRIKEQRDKMDATFSELSSLLVHDLRTPLAAMLGYLELMVDDPENAERYYCHAQEAGERQNALLRELLQLSRIEAGRQDLNLRRVDPCRLLDEVAHLVIPVARSRGLDLEFQVPADLPWLTADEGKLGQAVMNVVHNAVKFARTRVTVAARVLDAGLAICVQDDGPGVSPEEMPMLFEKWKQAGSGVSLGDGCGLGLAAAKALVDLHGGLLVPTLTEPSGMRFDFVLPLSCRAPA